MKQGLMVPPAGRVVSDGAPGGLWAVGAWAGPYLNGWAVEGLVEACQGLSCQTRVPTETPRDPNFC